MFCTLSGLFIDCYFTECCDTLPFRNKYIVRVLGLNNYCPGPIFIKIYILELVYQPCRLRHTFIKVYILELVYLTNDGHLPFHKITQYSIVVNTILLSNPRYCQYTTIVNNDTCLREQSNLGTSINHSTYIKYFTSVHCEKYFTSLHSVNYFTKCK